MNNLKNENTLRIFTLCDELKQLLGDKEAIADLEILYERHPEMFDNLQDVSNTIEMVIKKPTIAVNADREQKGYDVIKALTPLTKKMGGVIIKNDKGTNEIFHANKKKISEYTRFAKKIKPDESLIGGGENAQFSHPDDNQVRAAGISSMRSPINESIIPQTASQSKPPYKMMVDWL